MKYIAALILFVGLVPFVNAQQQTQTSAPVPVSAADKLAIETAIDSLGKIQTNASAVQNTFNTQQQAYNKQMASVKWLFLSANKAVKDAEDAAKKHLGVADDSVFDAGSFTFSSPPQKPTQAPVTPTPTTAPKQ